MNFEEKIKALEYSWLRAYPLTILLDKQVCRVVTSFTKDVLKAYADSREEEKQKLEWEAGILIGKLKKDINLLIKDRDKQKQKLQKIKLSIENAPISVESTKWYELLKRRVEEV